MEQNARALILKFAQELVGKTETSNNRSPEIDTIKMDLWGKTDELAYCADTVRWLAMKVDRELGTKNCLPATRSVRQMWNLSTKDERLALPIPGCAILWGFYDKQGMPTAQGHCGLVVGPEPNARLQTFEGNTEDQAGSQIEKEREGDGFYLRERSAVAKTGPMRLLGFLKIWDL